ncbi:MAG: APC family permease [Thermofilum sp.]
MKGARGEKSGLRREVGLFGAFSIGYADVGADIYITLGLIVLYAAGAAPLALALAAVVYVLTGLTYAKLSRVYPVAGGAQYYAYARFGPLHGFLAGWGLLLDYIVDIALFALASVGYLGFLVKLATGSSFLLENPSYALAACALTVFLVGLNLFGVKASSRFNEFIVAADLLAEFLVIGVGGFLLAMSGSLKLRLPAIGSEVSTSNFLYATTVAMASYVGVEATSQVAEEVRNPEKDVPRAILLTVATTVLVALIASTLFSSLGNLSEEDVLYPFSTLARSIPVLGPYLAVLTGLMGFLLSAASANAGVIGVSRVVFSMSRTNLLPKVLQRVNSRGAPDAALAVSGAVAASLLLTHALLPSVHLLEVVASLYNFGALIAYMYAHLALTSLNWKTEPRFRIKPVLQPIVGLAACAVMWILLFILHGEGRLLVALWIIAGIVMFLFSTRKSWYPAGRGRER